MGGTTDRHIMKYKGNREILFGKKGEGKRLRGEGQKEREESVHVQGLVVVPSWHVASNGSVQSGRVLSV